jgi:hypothetical protein
MQHACAWIAFSPPEADVLAGKLAFPRKQGTHNRGRHVVTPVLAMRHRARKVEERGCPFHDDVPHVARPSHCRGAGVIIDFDGERQQPGNLTPKPRRGVFALAPLAESVRRL